MGHSRSLQKRGMRRGAAIGIVFGVLLAIVLLLVTLTIPDLLAQATALLEREPVLREQLAQWLARRRMTASLASSLRQINYASLLGNSAQFAFTTSLRVAEMVAYGFGAVFLALYVMLDRDRLRGSLYALVPRTQHIALSRILLNLERIVGGYIRGQVITCVAMGLFMFALLRIAGVKSALALAVLAGVADVLPYVGGLLALGPAVLATLSLGPIVAGSVAAAILVLSGGGKSLACADGVWSRIAAAVLRRAGRAPHRWHAEWHCRRDTGAARRGSHPDAD